VDKGELLKQLQIDRSEPAAGPSRGRWWLAGVAGLLAVAAGAYAWLQRGEAAPEVQVAAVQATSQPAAQRSVLDATGYVTARRMATVSAQITGKVETVLIEEGMRVEADQVLATLDDTETRAQLALAMAQLDAARSQLAEIRAQLAQAVRERDRQQELIERGLAAQSGLDAARTEVEALQARLDSATVGIAVANRSVELAQVRLDNTVIRAPFAGVVIAKAAQPGEMISPVSAGGGFTRTGIGTIVDMDSLEVEVDVNEAFIGRVSASMPVTATLNAYPDWKIPGEVIAVIPAADRTKATVRVRVALGVKDARIVPDMGVRVAFLERSAPQATEAAATGVWVPAAAIAERGGQSVVFVLDGDRVSRRNVSLGDSRGDQRLVTRGLAPGQSVVLEPPPDLDEGDTVQRRSATRS
jgi:RND family efflux transporter MFP subunit